MVWECLHPSTLIHWALNWRVWQAILELLKLFPDEVIKPHPLGASMSGMSFTVRMVHTAACPSRLHLFGPEGGEAMWTTCNMHVDHIKTSWTGMWTKVHRVNHALAG